MPITIVRFDETPNPNALKCILSGPVGDHPRSFRSAAEAANDPLAAALFGIPGVTTVLINTDWLTVNKRPEVDWKPVKAGVRRAVEECAGVGGRS